MTDAMNPYLDSHQDRCILEEPASSQRSGPIVFFLMDLKNKALVLLLCFFFCCHFFPYGSFDYYLFRVDVNCSKDWQNVQIYQDKSKLLPKHQSFATNLIVPQRKKRENGNVWPVESGGVVAPPQDGELLPNTNCNQKLRMTVTEKDGYSLYNMNVKLLLLCYDADGIFMFFFLCNTVSDEHRFQTRRRIVQFVFPCVSQL